MSRTFLSKVVMRALGALLLLAAVLKLQGLGTDPVGRLGIFSAPEFQLAIVEFEVFLSVWLLSGMRPFGAWFVTLVTFVSFAGVSFYQGWVGRSSCGCFGRLSVSPWYAFGLDIGVVAALLIGRPKPTTSTEQGSSWFANSFAPAAWGLAGIIMVSGLLVGLAAMSFGSVTAAVAHFRGERISIQPRLIDLGKTDPGISQEIAIEVANWTDQPIRLIGGTGDCSCTVLNDLPVTIPARDTRLVKIRMRIPRQPGMFARQASFMVDEAGSMKLIGFRITGRIRKAEDVTQATGK